MGSYRSISCHCDPKTLAAIDLDGAWNVLKTRDLFARFTNDSELERARHDLAAPHGSPCTPLCYLPHPPSGTERRPVLGSRS
jgi:hypothetical protein